MDPVQLKAFDMFGDLLTERNKRVNLTAIRDEAGIVIKHFYDSLSIVIHVRELSDLLSAAAARRGVVGENRAGIARNGAVGDGGAGPRKKLADVGAGAGFPGIPLKILFGDALDVTLIESVGKKVRFMDEVIAALRLDGCGAVHIRAEDAARAGMGGLFDFATARALAPLPKTLEYCLPLIKTGGTLIAMKGRRDTADKEIAQSADRLTALGGKHLRTVGFAFPGSAERTILVIEKT